MEYEYDVQGQIDAGQDAAAQYLEEQRRKAAEANKPKMPVKPQKPPVEPNPPTPTPEQPVPDNPGFGHSDTPVPTLPEPAQPATPTPVTDTIPELTGHDTAQPVVTNTKPEPEKPTEPSQPVIPANHPTVTNGQAYWGSELWKKYDLDKSPKEQGLFWDESRNGWTDGSKSLLIPSEATKEWTKYKVAVVDSPAKKIDLVSKWKEGLKKHGKFEPVHSGPINKPERHHVKVESNKRVPQHYSVKGGGLTRRNIK